MKIFKLYFSFVSLVLVSFVLCSCNKLLLPNSSLDSLPSNDDIDQMPLRMIPHNGHCQIQNRTDAYTNDDKSRGRMFFMVFGQHVSSSYVTFGYKKIQGENIKLSKVIRQNIKVDNEIVNMVQGKIEIDGKMSHAHGTTTYTIVMRDRKKCQEQEGSDRICNLNNGPVDFISDIYDSTINLTIQVHNDRTYEKFLIKDILPNFTNQLNNYLPSGVDKITTILGRNLQKKLESNLEAPSNYLCINGWVL